MFQTKGIVRAAETALQHSVWCNITIHKRFATRRTIPNQLSQYCT